MQRILDSVEKAVDETIARVGKNLVVGAPLGLGKPVQLLNALFRRAQVDPELTLHIYTALSLELPLPAEGVESRLAQPIVERLFGDYEGLDYMRALRAGTMPTNVQVSELYFKAGSMKSVASAQQNYISSNYTHIARDMCALGINVLAHLVATREVAGEVEVSLSCNPDTGLDALATLVAHERDFILLGQAHPELPFMQHDAVVEDFFEHGLLIDDPSYNKRLFAVPNAAVPDTDYAAAIHASSLIADGGTLQIGIGSLGDAVAQACILRHRESVQYRNLLDTLTTQPNAATEDGMPFEQGLYVSTEMFVNGMMHLIEQGVVKRRVYDQLAIQRGLNDGAISEYIDDKLYRYLREVGALPRQLDAGSCAEWQSWGVLPSELRLSGATFELAGEQYPNDLDDTAVQQALVSALGGASLRNGRILHGGFFLGPRDFYQKLCALDDAGHQDIVMTSVLRTNQLLQDVPLYSAQRQHARFINTGMMCTLTGAVVSDALENGQVVSGVGGQYNFVAMAHDLPGARSVLCIRATRGQGDALQSNIVPFYGHITIPKHLRDIVVTEYGVADLRGQSDGEIIKRLLNIADSRFQDELLNWAVAQGKLEPGYEIPSAARNNTPGRIAASLRDYRRPGLLPDYPFGTELTDQEVNLAASLRRIKALSADPSRFLPQVARALIHRTDEDIAHAYLQRIELEHPQTSREFIIQQLLLLDLEERGLLAAG